MGAWDNGPFDNDHAADWVLTVVDDDTVDEVANALDVVTGAKGEPIGLKACCCAVAAAEVVSAAHGNLCRGFPKELKVWIREHAIYADRTLTSSAKLAVRTVLSGSELAELWDDNPGWKRRMNNLIKRLSQPSKVKRPRAKRATRPTASGSDNQKALIQKLRRLSDYLSVTKAGVIEDVDLSSGRGRADDLNMVLQIPTLLWLAIYYEGFGDSELDQISKHPRLEELRIDETGITDNGLKHLANLSTLKSLHISYCNVSDVGLNHLTKLSGLKSVWAHETGLTKKGIAKFRKVMPGCSVNMDLYRGVN